MPYVTNDDSKAVQRITEIPPRRQEAQMEFERGLAARYTPTDAAELAPRERAGKALTDRLGAWATALEVQRALASPALHEQERKWAQASPRKRKDFGYRPGTVPFLGGRKVERWARYWGRSRARADKGKGRYLGLALWGVCDRTTPALAGEVAPLAAALSSFEDARARLRPMGVPLSIRRIANVAYPFAQRARRRQELEGLGLEGSLAGKRGVISTDGGRLRVRRNKRGHKTQKGRSRYRTDWREPKRRVIYVGDEKGRLAQEFTPVMDGTRQGPAEGFRRLEFYLRSLPLDEAKEILFMAEGAKWIWPRVTHWWPRLGRAGVRCRELVDFYPGVEPVYALAALNRSWRASYRKQGAARQRRRLWRGALPAFLADGERLCQGKRGKGWAREHDYLRRNARAGRLDYAKARRAKLPLGRGTRESAIRRVVNLRLKGPGIFWHEDHAEQRLLLRTYYQSKHGHVLTRKAFGTPLTNAA